MDGETSRWNTAQKWTFVVGLANNRHAALTDCLDSQAMVYGLAKGGVAESCLLNKRTTADTELESSVLLRQAYGNRDLLLYFCCDKVANNASRFFKVIAVPSLKPMSSIFSRRASDSL